MVHPATMALHPVLAEQLSLAVRPRPPAKTTRRDARLSEVPGKVHAVIGMRRAGKTTYLRQLQEEQRLHQPSERALFLGFDDDRLAGIGSDQLDALFEEYYRRYPEFRGAATVHWYLDEIQLVDGWERFVRRAQDTEDVRIVVSGSSAKMLSREIHTSLRGRAMATVIQPFGFREYLRHRGEEPSSGPSTWVPAQRSLIEHRFREFMVEGGFPEAQGLPARTRVELLQGYVDTVLFRDVVERHGVSQVAALRWLVRHLLRNPAGHLSVNRLYKDLRSQGLLVGKDTVHLLMGHLVDAFLIAEVALATDSERRRNVNPRVTYPVDPGLIKAFDISGRSQAGRALEVIVANELGRRGAEVGYVKTTQGFEVDFLVRHPEGDEELIQVCAAPSSAEERELRALSVAAAEHPRAVRRLLVLDRDAVASVGGKDVEVRPVYEWLLAGT